MARAGRTQKHDKRTNFTTNAMRVHKKNAPKTIMRGGYRL